MTVIVSYQKKSDQYTTYTLLTPDSSLGESVELCTIDGTTYTSVPSVDVLPQQPTELTVTPATLTDELISEIKKQSPVIAWIDEQVRSKIAEQYSITDEIKMIRTGSGSDYETYTAYVESCRTWGRAQKTALGLTVTSSD